MAAVHFIIARFISNNNDMLKLTCLLAAVFSFNTLTAQQTSGFNGLNMSLGNIQKLSSAQTFSISPENFPGGKGQGGRAQLSDSNKIHMALSAHEARELGEGWKLNPAIKLSPGETFTLADITGAGAVQHIWMTPGGDWRKSIIRMYWDDEKKPSVECPTGDFFCMGLNRFAQVSSLPIAVNPGNGFNCYWPMPFRKHCRITIENRNNEDFYLFYQVDYTKTKVDPDDAYFHAQFRMNDPLDTSYHSVYTLIDGVKGTGQYVGCYMTWRQPELFWWGEGEIKMYLDGDSRYPTINGTGTEDYFLGSYGFAGNDGKTQTYTTPYAGLVQEIKPDSTNHLKYPEYAMYRWHIMEPVRFTKDLKITMQDLGWKNPFPPDKTYLAQRSSITSVVFWYQSEPHEKFPVLPSKNSLSK